MSSVMGSVWIDVLADAMHLKRSVSILTHGSYKPYTGKVFDIMDNSMVVLKNEYSQEYILLSEIRSVRVYG